MKKRLCVFCNIKLPRNTEFYWLRGTAPRDADFWGTNYICGDCFSFMKGEIEMRLSIVDKNKFFG